MVLGSIAGLFCILAICTWRRSGDLLIDYGRELYIAWRLSEGAVLYQDVHSLMGPAPAYVNGMIFRFAGPSITTMLLADLTILALTVAVLAWHFSKFVVPRTLFILLLTFLVLSGFSQPGGMGNYNFLTPYSHEATYGTLFALVCVAAISRVAVLGAPRWAGVCGLALGATFLTKPELFIAAALACIAGWTGYLVWPPSGDKGGLGRCSGAFLASLAAPPFIAFSLFLTEIRAPEALRAMAGAWVHVPAIRRLDSAYYRWIAGIDHPWENARILLLSALVVMLVAGIAIVLCRWLGARYTESGQVRLSLTAVTGTLAFGSLLLLPWHLLSRGYPLLVGAVLTHVCFHVFARDSSSRDRQFWLSTLVWSAFSLAMLVKILLFVRVVGYGFYLAMPASLLLAIYALEVLPAEMAERGHGATAFHRIALVLGLTFVLYYGLGSYTTIAKRQYPVGIGENTIKYATPAAAAQLNDVLRAIRREHRDSESLAVLPEGAGLNFIAMRPNPTGHVSLLPPEYASFSESSILRSFKREAPTEVLVWSRNLRSYGYGRFGEDTTYAKSILDLVTSEYEVLVSFPGEEFAVEGNLPDFVLFEHNRHRPDDTTPRGEVQQ